MSDATMSNLEHKNTGNESISNQPKKSLGIRILKWSFRILISILLLVFTLGIALQFSSVQTFIAQKLSAYLSDKWDIPIQIEKVDIDLFNSVGLEGVLIGDHHQDTLLYAGDLDVNIGYFSVKPAALSIQQVTLNNALFRLQKYPGEKALNINNLIDKFKSDKPKDTTKKSSFNFDIKNIEFNNVAFNLIDHNMANLPAAFQANNIRTQISYGDIKDFRISKDSIIFKINELQAQDISGVGFKNFQSDFVISSTCLNFDNAHIVTLDSSILNGKINLHYNTWGSYSYFMDSVRFDAELTETKVNASTIAYFTDNLKGLDLSIDLSAKAKGPISNLRLRNLKLKTWSNTIIEADADLIGLPNINETFIMLEADKIQTTVNDLKNVPLPPFSEGKKLELPAQMAALGQIYFNGEFTGLIHDFVAYGTFKTDIGNVSTDIKLSGDEKFKNPRYSGHIKSDGINLAKITGSNLLGNTVFDLDINGESFNYDKLKVRLNGNLQEFTLKGYTYHNISTNSGLDSKFISGRINIDDPNLNLSTDSITINLRQKRTEIDGNIFIKNWDLQKTNLIKDTLQVEKINLSLNAKFSNIDDLMGNVSADSIVFRKNEENRYQLNKLTIYADSMGSNRSFKLNSDYINAILVGQFKFVPLYHNILRNTDIYFPSFNLKYDTVKAKEPQSFAFNIELTYVNPITEVFIPQLSIAKNTKLNGLYRTQRSELDIVMTSGSIAYNKLRLENWNFNMYSDENEISLNSIANKFFVSDSMYFTNTKIISEAYKDSVLLTLSWDDDELNLTEGNFKIGTKFTKDSTYTFTVFPSHFSLQEYKFVHSTSSNLHYSKKGLLVEDLTFKTNTGQSLHINGLAGNETSDKIELTVQNFPLGFANRFLGKDAGQLAGIINGSVISRQTLKQPFLEAKITGDSLYFNQNELGRLVLSSVYDIEKEVLNIDANLLYKNRNSFTINRGKFYPLRKTDQFNIPINFDDFQISVAELFLAPIVTDMQGKLSGRMQLLGSIKKPDLRGTARLVDAAITVPIIGCRYKLNSDPGKGIVLNSKEINVGSITLTDTRGETAKLTGKLNHSYFANMALKLAINANDFLFLNTKFKQGDAFYGTIPATGLVKIEGPFDDIKITANAKTEDGGKLFLPMNSGPSKATSNNFVVFYDSRDTGKVDNTNLKKEISVVTLDMFIDVTENCEVQIIFDETVGDVLKAQGRGSLRIELNKLFELKMFGEFEVYKGDYLFTLENIINKKLQLKPGGMIYWSGDPINAKINASAVYELRASPYPLVQNQTMGSADSLRYKSKTTTNVLVNLGGQLMNPLISFGIDFPTQSDEFKTTINQRLTSEDEKNKQAFSLLVLGQFVPPSNSSGSIGFSGGGAAGSNSLEVLSNQLSNWLSSLTGNVDLGVRYRAADGTSSGSNEVELNVSGKFLNDRIIIDGNFGVATNNNTSTGGGNNNASKTAGIIDVNIEYKITDDGRLRLRAFNRSNDGYLTVAFPYTQGVGLNFSTSFDSWKEITFKKNKKKNKTTPQTPAPTTPQTPAQRPGNSRKNTTPPPSNPGDTLKVKQN